MVINKASRHYIHRQFEEICLKLPDDRFVRIVRLFFQFGLNPNSEIDLSVLDPMDEAVLSQFISILKNEMNAYEATCQKNNNRNNPRQVPLSETEKEEKEEYDYWMKIIKEQKEEEKEEDIA